MIKDRLKLIGGAVIGAIVVGAGAYLYGASSTTPEIATVSNLGCGAGGGDSFGVPLRTVSSAAPTMSVSYGAIEMPGVDRVVRLSFDRAVDGGGKEVPLIGDTLHLPLTFGDGDATPTRIRINCRNGTIAGVRYNRDRSTAIFEVVQPDVSETAEETSPAPGTTEG